MTSPANEDRAPAAEPPSPSAGQAGAALVDLRRELATGARGERRIGPWVLRARRGRSALRCAVGLEGQEPRALFTLVGQDLLRAGPIVAELLRHASTARGDGHARYAVRDVMVAMRMRAWRWPEPDRHGMVTVRVPGATVEVHGHHLTAWGEHGAVEVAFESGTWAAQGVAAVADAALRAFGRPEARHLTWTTEPRGWYFPSDHPHPALRGSAGLNKPGGRAGKLYDGSSLALCTCGWRDFADDRVGARWAARRHRERAGGAD
ncbi:hypothetical protein [Streptomyces sp. NPDC001404]|uniref:hypothetical protein n=1 Tax=Streptomyces sp. NPDC001404 TaxID=3364571 RepID=UPI0036951E3A